MTDISKITLPSGSTYNIKDQGARNLIAELQSYSDYLGVTTTALINDSETNPIKINNADVTAVKGNIVNYGSKEFIFNGTKWQEFGDLSALKALAYKASASGSITPSGSVSTPTFTGSGVSYTPQGSVSVGSVTPSGTVSKPTFSGTSATIVVSKATSGDATYTPTGTVSKPTFTGSASNVTVSTGTGTANYTPSGTVSKPSATVTPTTATVNSITGVGTLPSLTTSVSNETLTIGFNQGTLPTKGSNQTVMTGASVSVSQPTFSGTGVELKGTVTPSGSVSTPTFTGSGARLTASYTPSGSVSQPTFSGSAVTPTATFTGTQATITATGTVSKPTFTGNSTTVTVS